MTAPHDLERRTRTLWLCAVLHAFTHIYQVALLPLYLLIQADLQLASIERATLLVTFMMVAYFLPSFPMGILADSVSRKQLLGWGLAVNALGFVGLAHAQSYPAALGCVVVAGLGGSFFHPAATALIARLFPIGTGKALGYLGMGASVGFFAGPLFSGWRAAMTGNWRTPVLELGLLGLLGAALFLWLAEDTPGHSGLDKRRLSNEPMFRSPALWLTFIACAFAFSLRDFAGSSMGTLGSLFLQKAHGYDLGTTGLALSSIFVVGAISNPLFGGLSDRGRIRWTTFVLIAAAAMIFLFPRMPEGGLIPAFAIYGFFFMASYPMVEAALMESAPDSVRGRVFGFFITIGGLLGNLAHWFAGHWVKALDTSASQPASYFSLYALLSGLVLLSLAGLPCLHAIRRSAAEPPRALSTAKATP